MQMRLSPIRVVRLALPDLGFWLGTWNAAGVAVAAVTLFFGYLGGTTTGSHTTNADRVLKDAYAAVVDGRIQPKAFPDRHQASRAIGLGSDRYVVLPSSYSAQADYDYLRHHSGGQGTVYVRHVDKTHLDLVARYHHDAIRELQVSLPQLGPAKLHFHGLYTGHYDWPVVLGFLAAELGLANLLGLILGVKGARTMIGRQRRWLEAVNDSRLGPWQREQHFAILLPVCDESDGQVLMRVKQLSWSQGFGHDGCDYGWRGQYLYDRDYRSHGLEEVTVARADGVAAVTSRWFEYCAQVATVNAATWKAERERRERQAEEKRLAEERRRLDKAEAALAEREQNEEEIASLLPHAQTLMTQALDAQPLAE